MALKIVKKGRKLAEDPYQKKVTSWVQQNPGVTSDMIMKKLHIGSKRANKLLNKAKE